MFIASLKDRMLRWPAIVLDDAVVGGVSLRTHSHRDWVMFTQNVTKNYYVPTK